MVRTFGGSTLAVKNTCGCFGFNFTGSGTSGLTTGGAFALTFGGGGGSGATGINVTGCISSVGRRFRAVFICSGKIIGIKNRNIRIAIWLPALIPMRSQRGFGSGSRARRAAIGFVPIACFHAWGLDMRPRLASKPTPIVVLRGGSAIMVVIRNAASREILSCKLGCLGIPSVPKFAGRIGNTLSLYQSTSWVEGVRIGLWY